MVRLQRTIATLIFLLTVPGVARAHEISGRFEAPLPLPLLFGAAGVTVGITAIMLASTVEESTPDIGFKSRLSISPSIASGLRLTARGLFFGAFVLVIATGLLGRQVQAENFATVFVWAVWIKGVAIVAALIGSPWRVLSPWQTLYDTISRVEGQTIALVSEYPSWLGAWPALGWYLLLIGVVENLSVVPRSPRLTVLLIIGYTLVMFLCGVAFGPTWFQKADGLAVLYRLFGRVAPANAMRTDEGGYRIGFRAPWRGCTRHVSGLAVTAFVIATVYTVSFDGFTSTPEYQAILFGFQEMFSIGSNIGTLLYLTGLFVFITAFLVIVVLTHWITTRSDSGWQATAFALAPTILPIAIAYEIAHNYPFVLGNIGQLLAVLWPFFGLGHGPTIDLLGWLSVGAFWWSQVFFIVGGHIVAVVAAHYVVLGVYENAKRGRKAHIPLVVLMIGYTILSLWIISRPIVA